MWEVLAIIDNSMDKESADIAIRQDIIRQGLDLSTRIDSEVNENSTRGRIYLFSTVGMTDVEHSARLQELTELGQFNGN